MLRRSRVEVYFHVVWATRGRVPVITPDIEDTVHRCIAAEAERLRCELIALNGTQDHVHLLVRIPSTLSPAQLAKQVKGVSSTVINDQRSDFSDQFRWQNGYGCFSLWRSQIPKLAEYIHKQKEHHASGMIWQEWEETDEPAPGAVAETTVPGE